MESDITETAEQFQEQAENLRQMGRDWQRKARLWKQKATDRVRNLSGTTNHYVRDNPWPSLAIAALAGCTLGWLIGRARD